MGRSFSDRFLKSMGLRIHGEPFDQHRGQGIFGSDVHVSLLVLGNTSSMTLKAWYEAEYD
jgi:hypothetical protein